MTLAAGAQEQPAAAPDPHAGMDMPQTDMSQMDMSDMDMSGMDKPTTDTPPTDAPKPDAPPDTPHADMTHTDVPHADMAHTDMAQMEMPGMDMSGALGPYPMTRESSGTSWQPDETAHGGLHAMHGPWSLMAHAAFNVVQDQQDGPPVPPARCRSQPR